MWRGKKVSVVFPTYNEAGSIRQACLDFFATGYVDEVLVVNNNAAPGTSEAVAGTGAREVFEAKQGYGHAIQRGLREAQGDLLIIAEPDGTFMGRDTLKLLAYSDEFDYVVGTRTTHEYIWDGANMDFWLKWGNVAVAKMVELLFSSSILTDVGCTMRLIHRDAYERVRDRFTVGGSHFGLEMTLICLTSEVSMTEIPVNYCPRVGVSSVTGNRLKAIQLGATMATMVLKRALTDKVLARRHRIPSTTRRPPPPLGKADAPRPAPKSPAVR
jgi:glycosyltransferase involved in cell wall biosynthesis